MNQNYTMPIGFLQGKKLGLHEALLNLSNEIMGHASDLEEQYMRDGWKSDNNNSMKEQAALLRRYAWALSLIIMQMEVLTMDALLPPGIEEVCKLFNLAIPDSLVKVQP